MSDSFPRISGTNRDKSLLESLAGWIFSAFSYMIIATLDPEAKCDAGDMLGTGPLALLSPVGNEIPFLPEGNTFPEGGGNGATKGAIRKNSILYDGVERYYYSYIPECAGSKDNGNAPLMIDIHAWSFCPTATMVWSGWREMSDEECFLVMWPFGDMTAGFPGFPSWRGSDTEFAYIQEMAVDFKNKIDSDFNGQFTLDPKRIYTSGLSNGAGASYDFGLKASDFVAGVTCFSGAVSVLPPQDYTPVPVIAYHGENDILVPYKGVGPLPSFPEARDLWLNANGCTGMKTQEYPIPDMDLGDVPGVLTAWEGEGCAKPVKFFSFNTAGHITIGGVKEVTPTKPFATDTTLDTTRMAWDFVSQYSKDSTPPVFLQN